MINQQLINPKSIAVIGASENKQKPGGKILCNLIEHHYQGIIYAVNKNKINIKGCTYIQNSESLPFVDLAILAIPSDLIIDEVSKLIAIGAKAFIIFSSGFAEAGDLGAKKQNELLELISNANASLIGPNCIGLINENYKGVFTSPIPKYDPYGCELISNSGATAVFIMEAAFSTGLSFSNIYSIGNAAQIGVEEILEYMDLNFDINNQPKSKLLYIENIKNPVKFMKHASSLVKKGCNIAAIKSGHSEAGGRAVSSHTGALATSDKVIRAMFKKCGIIYCSGRAELITVGCIFQISQLKGNRLAIITHAGGAAVMLTDALSKHGMEIPEIPDALTTKLSKELNPGSSLKNPIDFLATGNAIQLSKIIDFCENLDNIDGIIVVFGSPGLFDVKEVYNVLDEKIKSCKKPIYSVLPSLVNAKKETENFISKGHVNFPDEVVLGNALPQVYYNSAPTFGMTHLASMETATIRRIISEAPSGYLNSTYTQELMNAVGIPLVKEYICYNENQVIESSKLLNFPLVLKAYGPIHKTEMGGVSLNILTETMLLNEYKRLIKLNDVKGVIVQEMLSGEELYCGAVNEGLYGHLIVCGMGGIFVEVIQDTAFGIAPLTPQEVQNMIRSLKCYKVINGYRNLGGVNEKMLNDAIVRVASLVYLAPEIIELDINPFKGNKDRLIAVDVRIKISKNT